MRGIKWASLLVLNSDGVVRRDIGSGSNFRTDGRMHHLNIIADMQDVLEEKNKKDGNNYVGFCLWDDLDRNKVHEFVDKDLLFAEMQRRKISKKQSGVEYVADFDSIQFTIEELIALKIKVQAKLTIANESLRRSQAQLF